MGGAHQRSFVSNLIINNPNAKKDLGVRFWHIMPLLMRRELQRNIDGYAVIGFLSVNIKCRYQG
ncbi:MAG: hypothetical protein K8F30_07935, partial [Taibaiella sp.]|nr:hypothetical protein [Taibaiella sp.]